MNSQQSETGKKEKSQPIPVQMSFKTWRYVGWELFISCHVFSHVGRPADQKIGHLWGRGQQAAAALVSRKRPHYDRC